MGKSSVNNVIVEGWGYGCMFVWAGMGWSMTREVTDFVGSTNKLEHKSTFTALLVRLSAAQPSRTQVQPFVSQTQPRQRCP
jgi:hypothetical protein